MDANTHDRSRRSPMASLAVVGLCAATTLLATPLLGHLDLTNIALVYVLVVTITSLRWGRTPGVLAAVLSVALFDFFFVPPRFSFTVDQAQYLVTFGVMLVVSLVISHLTGAVREKSREAERRATDAVLLQHLAGALAAAPDLHTVLDRVAAELRVTLDIGVAVFLDDGSGHVRLRADTPLAAHPPGDIESMVAQGVHASGEATHAAADLRPAALALFVPVASNAVRYGVLEMWADYDAAERLPGPGLATAIAAAARTAIERAQATAAAQAAVLEAQSERLRNTILAAISHDLRTPLTVLFGQADALVQRGDLDDAARAAARELREHSRGLHRMVENLLELARLRSGRVTLARDWQSPAELIGACVRTASAWFDTARLALCVADDLPLVEVDATLFERVLHNLLDNAVKYATHGSIITIEAREERGELQVAVRNRGRGFDPQRIDMAFEPFMRGDGDSATPGSGLGLAVCSAIVTAHGGSIRARNLADGCEVRFTLPMSAQPPLPDDVLDEAGSGAASHA